MNERTFRGTEGPIDGTRVILSADRKSLQFGGLTSTAVIHDGDDYVSFDTSAGNIRIYNKDDERNSKWGDYTLIEQS
jgi:hypothetical protein